MKKSVFDKIRKEILSSPWCGAAKYSDTGRAYLHLASNSASVFVGDSSKSVYIIDYDLWVKTFLSDHFFDVTKPSKEELDVFFMNNSENINEALKLYLKVVESALK